jgi:hypothetical protein
LEPKIIATTTRVTISRGNPRNYTNRLDDSVGDGYGDEDNHRKLPMTTTTRTAATTTTIMDSSLLAHSTWSLRNNDTFMEDDSSSSS